MLKTITPNWPQPANIRALTTTKHSTGAELKAFPNPVSLTQVHGATVVNAEDIVKLPTASVEADGLITSTPGIGLMIKTADCLPVLITATDGSQVAALHAGWRSLSLGIIASACQMLSHPLKNYLVWLGPCISQRYFEVGADVLADFENNGWPAAVVAANCQEKSANKYHLDLVGLARYQLVSLGCSGSQIYCSELCTYACPDDFYSYRRGRDKGRLQSLISII